MNVSVGNTVFLIIVDKTELCHWVWELFVLAEMAEWINYRVKNRPFCFEIPLAHELLFLLHEFKVSLVVFLLPEFEVSQKTPWAVVQGRSSRRCSLSWGGQVQVWTMGDWVWWMRAPSRASIPIILTWNSFPWSKYVFDQSVSLCETPIPRLSPFPVFS